MAKVTEYLIDPDSLRSHRSDPNLILVDTRPMVDYWKGHLEGARHFDPFPFHHSDTSEAGLRNFRDHVIWLASILGIEQSKTAVFYEENSGMRATRAAWMFEYVGHPNVRILDGGLGSFQEKLVTSAPAITAINFAGDAREETIASWSYIMERLGRPGVQILDVRTDEEYYGERIRAKHGGAIPGAIHREWVNHLSDRGAFKPPEQLRAEFEQLGLDPSKEIIPYCQGGYRSANAYVALRIAGYSTVRNYLGSWAEWGNRDDLPIERPRRRAPE